MVDSAWVCDFAEGFSSWHPKSGIQNVRAVRGEHPAPSFTDNGDGTITDNNTGLMWAKTTADINGNGVLDEGDTAMWPEALYFCENLTLAGYDDWRLPTVKELVSIVDYNASFPAIDTTYFPDTEFDYWTSTSWLCDGYSGAKALCLYFDYGNIFFNNFKILDLHVRPVRGGQ